MAASVAGNLKKLVGVLGVGQSLRFAFHKLIHTERVRLRVSGIPTPLLCRTNYSDVRVLWQVFGAQGVDVALPAPPRLIVDGGANVGYTSVFFAHRYPAAQVLAVEPDPGNCALIEANCRDYPNVRVVQGALWPTNAKLVIDNPTAASWGFRVREELTRSPGSFPGTTIPDLLRLSGCDRIDLLKLDVEGAERHLFGPGINEWLDHAGVILVEVHGPEAADAVRRAAARSFAIAVEGEKWVLRRHDAPAVDPNHAAGPGPHRWPTARALER